MLLIFNTLAYKQDPKLKMWPTHAEVHAGDQGADPCRLASALPEVLDEGVQEDTEGKTDAVDNDISEEGRNDDYPTPPAIWRQRYCYGFVTDIASFWTPRCLVWRFVSCWHLSGHFVRWLNALRWTCLRLGAGRLLIRNQVMCMRLKYKNIMHTETMLISYDILLCTKNIT